MKLLAFALDFDGTIAVGDRLDSDVRTAIGYLRSQNIIVLLVTGRILSELRQVAGDLHFVDAIVAENGAVIYFPDSGYSKVLVEPPAKALLEKLSNGQIQYKAGQAVVEMDASVAPQALAILQSLELPLALLFNRARMMILPQAVSKATGLEEVMKVLRLSSHNAIAIGDAENDHALLKACEFGAAVGWGSQALKNIADEVIDGSGPPAVASFLRRVGSARRIPIVEKQRRRLALGYTDMGEPFVLAVRDRRLLIAGDTKSGKSWIAGLMCEQLILLGYALLIIDPEGDYVSLEALPGVTVYGGADPLPRPRDLIRALRHADVSVVIDLSHTEQSIRVGYVHNLFDSLKALRAATGLPHYVVLDEAHYFLHRDLDPEAIAGFNLDSTLLVSYRTTWMHPDVLAGIETVFTTRESDPHEVRTLAALCPSCRGTTEEEVWLSMFQELPLGEAIALPLTTGPGVLTRFRLSPRLTPHVRHVAKYVDIPVPASEQFVFWSRSGMNGQVARTLGELIEVLENSQDGQWDGHLRQHDFSRWIADVFGDYPLAKTIKEMEARYAEGTLPDIVQQMVQAIRTRYECANPLHGL